MLCYAGDKPTPYPYMCAVEVLLVGIGNIGLRDEIYCQIMKQLQGNPGDVSTRRYWKLLHLCFKFFPPKDTENYLDYMIRKNL